MIADIARRSLIGKQPFKGQVWCCGRRDEASILSEIAGWAVESVVSDEHREEIADLTRRGLITTRRHVTPGGDGWVAYALTDAGFDRLAEIGYGSMHDDALRKHQFYADRGSLCQIESTPSASDSEMLFCGGYVSFSEPGD